VPFCDDVSPSLVAFLADRAETRARAKTDAAALIGWRVSLRSYETLTGASEEKAGVVVDVKKSQGFFDRRTKCVVRLDGGATEELDLDRAAPRVFV